MDLSIGTLQYASVKNLERLAAKLGVVPERIADPRRYKLALCLDIAIAIDAVKAQDAHGGST
jgi:hypothetical protein